MFNFLRSRPDHEPASEGWPGLHWIGPASFSTKNFRFDCSVSDYTQKTDADRIILLKNREFLDKYAGYLPANLGNVFELGFFQGGMPLLLADTFGVNKIVAVDRGVIGPDIRKHLYRARLNGRVRLHEKVNQEDSAKLRSILDREFGSKPLDLIIDDCSHMYGPTKSSFEATFGYLKPGGKFFLEDWGWAHWPGEPWQSDNTFRGQPALTNFLFQAIMAHASAPGIISSVEVLTPWLAAVTRGPELPHKALIDLASLGVTAGRKFSLLAKEEPMTTKKPASTDWNNIKLPPPAWGRDMDDASGLPPKQ